MLKRDSWLYEKIDAFVSVIFIGVFVLWMFAKDIVTGKWSKFNK